VQAINLNFLLNMGILGGFQLVQFIILTQFIQELDILILGIRAGLKTVRYGRNDLARLI
jgi:hypothetical protein